jgi:phospholipase C
LTLATRAAVLAGLFALTACHSSTIPLAPSEPSFQSQLTSHESLQAISSAALRGKFKHVVIVVQENRTPDNLFNGLPGADTVRSGRNSHGQTVPLTEVSLSASYDLQHMHVAFVTEYARGKMDGFDLVKSHCQGKCPPAKTRAYGFIDPTETRPYFTMAKQFAFADRMFQSNQGPSFPAHLYVISGSSEPSDGSSLKISENALRPGGGHTAGCDSPPGTKTQMIDPNGNENHWMFPCIDVKTIFDSLHQNHLTWRYYQNNGGPGLWHAIDAIKHLRNGKNYKANVVFSPAEFLIDVAKGNLTNLSVVTPTAQNSDHAGITGNEGPSWVAQVVNAVGTSQYWKDTAIFVTWDDWGGWYDHVPPPIYNSYELGMRVPLIVISPFTPAGYVSHTQHEFGSVLKFVEETFGLGLLGTTDVRSDDLSDCFSFGGSPRKFVKIPAPKTAVEFLREKASSTPPDDD